MAAIVATVRQRWMVTSRPEEMPGKSSKDPPGSYQESDLREELNGIQ
jgi:hypothetical protein